MARQRILCHLCGLFLLGSHWVSCAQARVAEQLPIHVVYINHVEVESVLDYVPPLVDGGTYSTVPANYAFTSGRIEWEIAQAEAVGGSISFHMSGAYAERAVTAADQTVWAQHLAAGHTVGVHFHSFLRGPSAFEWTYDLSASQPQIAQAWQDNYDLAANLVGALWIGESHYSCNSCWVDLGYRLRTNEQMAMLPAGQHIVWLVERDPAGVISYPHFPQIGQAGWHGPAGNQTYFDLRIPQLKKEFLMLYLEWLERERLNLEPQVWAWGFANHAGQNTDLYATEIQEMLAWLSANFAAQTSARGNVVAQFVGDHELSAIYESYELAGGQPMPSPLTNINDRFPYMSDALTDAGVTADLSGDLGLPGTRLFELERDPPQTPSPGPLPLVYLLFRETDASGPVDISGTLTSRGVDAAGLTLIDVVNGGDSQVDGANLTLGSVPMVLEANYLGTSTSGDSPFGFHPASVGAPGYPDNGFVDAQNIGVRWARQGVYAFWFLIQPDLNQPVYDFALYDQQWSAVPLGLSILANISPGPQGGGSRTLPGSWIPVDIPQYTAFVHSTVERYDGDGMNDMPGLVNPIKFWQVGNEPNEQVTSDFAFLQQITYEAVKAACVDCTVLIGGATGSPNNYIAGFDSNYAPILAQLAGQYVDVFDFHWYGTASGEYRLRDSLTGEDVYAHMRNALTSNGFPSSLPIWITEMGSYSGDPPASPFPPFTDFPPQTEQQQASDYFKRFIYSLSRGVQKIFSAFGIMEGFIPGDRNYFDHTGLIYNGIGQQDPDYPDADPDDLGLGVKKLGYYTYKKMTEKLEGADWTTVTLLRDGTVTDWLYLVSVEKDGQPVYIAWWDYFDEPGYAPGDTKDIILTGVAESESVVTTVVPYAELGQDVTDYTTAFDVTTFTIIDGSVTIPLGEDPVIIETTSSSVVPAVSAWGLVVLGLLLLAAATVISTRRTRTPS